MKYIFILICFLLSGCGEKPGKCYELTDGSGRKGIYIEYNGYHLLRMIDTGNVEAKLGGGIVFIDDKYCK